jgi:hypothetical protein
MTREQQLLTIERVAKGICAIYGRVARGETKGAMGTWAADGKPTLTAVSIDVDMLERLCLACDMPVVALPKKPPEGP